MNQATLRLVVAACGLVCSSALAQNTVYSDNFASDGSLSSSYLNINNVSGTTNVWIFTPNTQLTLGPSASGKLDDVVGSYTPVTLAQAGDYISFVVTFNSPNIGQAGTAGGLLFSLDYSGGVGLLSGGPGPLSPTANTGATAGYIGYLGNIAMNTTPKTGSKQFAKTGTGANDLSYNSDATPDTQLSTTVPNASNAVLANNHNYTLTYTITAQNTGATQNVITEQLVDNSAGNTTVDNFSFIGTNGTAAYITPSTTYDTFDMGVYTGSEAAGYNLNLTSLSVLTSVAVPEPSTLALAGAGFGLAVLARFRRR